MRRNIIYYLLCNTGFGKSEATGQIEDLSKSENNGVIYGGVGNWEGDSEEDKWLGPRCKGRGRV